MKRIIHIIAYSFFCLSIFAQDQNGTITYERKLFWVNIYSKLPFLSQEEKEKELAIWGKDQGKYADKYTLQFNATQSLYQQIKTENEYGWSWKGDGIMFYRDHQNKMMHDKQTLADKDFVIKGEIPRIKWKMQNELRDVLGYICMKASGIHPVHNTPITVWYTDKIPVSGGPEGLGGLPGMILMVEYNDNDVLIEATHIKLEQAPVNITFPKKIKGKEVTFDKYKEDFNKYISQSLAAKRNPYWNVRL